MDWFAQIKGKPTHPGYAYAFALYIRICRSKKMSSLGMHRKEPDEIFSRQTSIGQFLNSIIWLIFIWLQCRMNNNSSWVCICMLDGGHLFFSLDANADLGTTRLALTRDEVGVPTSSPGGNLAIHHHQQQHHHSQGLFTPWTVNSS